MREQTLNGTWQYRVGKGAWAEKEVPFSTKPVGHSECRCMFTPAAASPRTFLRFDGINYYATVILNGVKLGEMLPYCTYLYDITEHLLAQDNDLVVELEDITPTFGPSEGWENYGGIPRDVTLLFGEAQYLTDVFFSAKLTDNYTAAEMTVQTTAQFTPGDRVRVTLLDGEREVLCFDYEQRIGASETRTVQNVRLWSPEEPCLYTLHTELIHEGHVVDTDTRAVGFREFAVGKRRFFLNGKPIFLYGVCRHEMFGDRGHITDPARIEADMRQIKEMGCNYVRLVHYPHSRVTLDIADRLGLMVSEEPGLWWSDTANQENHDGSLEVLRRTILRDRSHASIVFWLCFNECKFTEQFLIDSAKTCRAWDSTRPVSGANCMSLEDTVKYYELCGFDFYTMHPYDSTTKRIRDSVEALRDKPLIFTEWGGYYVYDNPGLLRQFIRQMIAYWQEPDIRADGTAGNVLAGACYWCYADMHEFNRRRPAVQDGILTEGLVDIWRRPSTIFEVFRDTWRELSDRIDPADCFASTITGEKPTGTPLTLPVQSDEVWEAAMVTARAPIPRYQLNKRERRLTFGPTLHDPLGEGLSQRPGILADGMEWTLDADGVTAGRLTVLGAVSVSDAYPITPMARYGETAATVTVEYANGTAETIPLQNGVHFTTVFTTFGPSRIDPIAEQATPWATFSYDKNFENYLINRLDLTLSAAGAVKQVRITSENNGYQLLFWGIFAE